MTPAFTLIWPLSCLKDGVHLCSPWKAEERSTGGEHCSDSGFGPSASVRRGRRTARYGVISPYPSAKADTRYLTVARTTRSIVSPWTTIEKTTTP